MWRRVLRQQSATKFGAILNPPLFDNSTGGTDQRCRTALHFAAHEGSTEVGFLSALKNLDQYLVDKEKIEENERWLTAYMHFVTMDFPHPTTMFMD